MQLRSREGKGEERSNPAVAAPSGVRPHAEKTSTFIPDQQATKRRPHPCGNATMLTKPRTA